VSIYCDFLYEFPHLFPGYGCRKKGQQSSHRASHPNAAARSPMLSTSCAAKPLMKYRAHSGKPDLKANETNLASKLSSASYRPSVSSKFSYVYHLSRRYGGLA
jgi:hypothetical protein